MRKAKDKRHIRNVVHTILTVDEATRSNDSLLRIRVVEKLDPSLLEKPLKEALVSCSMPSSESVTRARRIIQEKNPQLCANDKVSAYRLMEEQDYKEMVKNG